MGQITSNPHQNDQGPVLGAIQKKRIRQSDTDPLCPPETIYKAILTLYPLKKICDFAIFSLQNQKIYSDGVALKPFTLRH